MKLFVLTVVLAASLACGCNKKEDIKTESMPAAGATTEGSPPVTTSVHRDAAAADEAAMDPAGEKGGAKEVIQGKKGGVKKE
jgi:hypothetical protein